MVKTIGKAEKPDDKNKSSSVPDVFDKLPEEQKQAVNAIKEQTNQVDMSKAVTINSNANSKGLVQLG